MAWHRWPHVVGAIALVLAILAFRPTASFACACADVYVPPDVVFVGRVLAVMDVPWLSEWLWATHRFTGGEIALFAVDLMWQGAPRPLFFVVGGPGDCALSFQQNHTYLININGRRGAFGLIDTDVCGSSREMEYAISNVSG